MMTLLPRSSATSFTTAKVGIAGGFCCASPVSSSSWPILESVVELHLDNEVSWRRVEGEERAVESKGTENDLERRKEQEERSRQAADPWERSFEVIKVDVWLCDQVFRRSRS